MTFKNKAIGISGNSRVGKNLAAELISNYLTHFHNAKVRNYSLAHELKRDCNQFIKEKFGLDSFSEITEEKNVFRPILVAVADIQRKRTNGRYFIDILSKSMTEDTESDIMLITDIRYCEYDNDEAQWVKNELNGKILHVSKYTVDNNLNRVYTPPANENENRNDPIIKDTIADARLEWEDISYKENKKLTFEELSSNKDLISKIQNVVFDLDIFTDDYLWGLETSYDIID